MTSAKLTPQLTEPKATRQTVRGLGYMTVYGIFEAVETRTGDGLELGQTRRWGWVRSSRLPGGYSLVSEASAGVWWQSGIDNTGGLSLKPASAESEPEAGPAAEPEAEPASVDGYSLAPAADDPSVSVVRKDGRKLCEVASVGDRFQVVAPWSHQTYASLDEAVRSAR